MQPNGGQSNDNSQSGHYAMLNYRIVALEKDLKSLKDQMQTYVPQTISDLQLKIIHESIGRVESDVKDLYKLVIWIVRGLFGGAGAIIIALAVYYFTHLP